MYFLEKIVSAFVFLVLNIELLDGWLIIKILRYVLWNERGSVCQCGLFTFMMACLISDEGCLKLDSSMYCHQFNSI